MTYPPAMRPPDATKHAIAMARALTIGLRAWKFYPEEHPALGMAMDRLASVTADVTAQGPLMLAVTNETLIVDGVPLEADMIVSDCARLLHDVDLIQVAFVGAAPRDAVRNLVAMLNLDRK